MKHLVVLGAGEDQLPAYREARRRGMPTVGVDMRADALGAVVADRFLHITTRDAAAIAAALDGLPVAGVIAPAGDAAQPTVRALSQRLGLEPIVSETAARCSSDKGAFRVVLDGIGLPTYRSCQHHDHAALAGAAVRIGYPVMVKPSDSSGSKGVSYVTHPCELDPAIEVALAHSVSGEVIVEEFVQGRHLAAECFFAQGRLDLLALTERTTTGPPGMITITHRTPAAVSKREHHAIATAVSTAARGVGLVNGPMNLDLVLSPDGTPYLIEMGARLGGNGMPQLVGLTHGVDTVAAAVAHACGQPFDVRPRFTRAAVLHILHTHRSGTLRRLCGLEALDHWPEVVSCELFVAPGDEVKPYTKAANKLGYVLLAGESRGRLEDCLSQLGQALSIELEHEDREMGVLSCERC